MNPETILALKNEGTAALQNGAHEEAISKYDEVLKNIDASHEQFLPVNGNKALACMKAGRWREGIEAADAALAQLLPTHAPEKEALYQKVLFRKGVCEQSLQQYNIASETFAKLYKADPSNVEAARRMNECQAKQRKRYGAMFKESFYDDRMAETEKLRQAELEEYERSHAEGETFDIWKAAKDAAAEEERKAKQREAPPVSLLGGSAKQDDSPSKQNKSSTVELEFDEEDRQILKETKSKGYCYFRRELTEDERRMKDTVHVPQKLDDTTPTVSETSPQRGVSSWNNGSTYEEKDTTNWCKTMLESYLSEVHGTSKDLAFKVTEVNSLNGDAQLMVVRGSLRHFFDMSVVLNFEVKRGDDVVAEGRFRCESVSGAVSEGNFLQSSPVFTWTKALPSADSAQFRDDFVAAVNQQVRQFYELYQQKH